MGKRRNGVRAKRKKEDRRSSFEDEVEEELLEQIDLGIVETIREDLNIIQVNMGKKHDADHLDYYFSERRLKADIILVQEPPLCWDDGGVLGIRGFTAYHWMKEDKKLKKDKIVTELVTVGGKRGKRKGGKKSLVERMNKPIASSKGKKTKGVSKSDKVEGKVKSGKKLTEGMVNSLGGGDHVRTCVYVRNNLIDCLSGEGLSRDQVAVEICHNSSDKLIVVSSLYVENGKFPEKMLRRVANTPWMRSQRVIMGADSNSRHAVWNSKSTNKRGEKFLEWMADCGLVVINARGHGPTWSRTHQGGIRESHIDVTMVSEGLRKEMEDWRLREDLEEPSDHKSSVSGGGILILG